MRCFYMLLAGSNSQRSRRWMYDSSHWLKMSRNLHWLIFSSTSSSYHYQGIDLAAYMPSAAKNLAAKIFWFSVASCQTHRVCLLALSPRQLIFWFTKKKGESEDRKNSILSSKEGIWLGWERYFPSPIRSCCRCRCCASLVACTVQEGCRD